MKLNEIKPLFEAASLDAESWLDKYTRENANRWPDEDVLDELLSEYPYDGGTLYRGLNFADKEQWDKFVEETKNLTVLDTGSISSWSPVKKEANAFALTRPTYFLNFALMQAEAEKKKNIDYMIGHIGVILKTTVGKGVGIDVNKSEHAKEREVILAPGTYKIEVDTKHIPFIRSITKENFKEQFLSISSIKNDDFDSKKFNHIMFHYKDFDKEMRSHLFKLCAYSLESAKFYVDFEKEYDWDEVTWNKGTEDKYFPSVRIGWNIPATLFVYYAMLLPGDQAKVDKVIVEILHEINDKFDEALEKENISPTSKFKIDISPSILLAVRLEKFERHAKFLSKANKLVGARYNELNSYSAVKKINQIADPEEKQTAIELMTKNLIQALNNLQK